jgi:hypothetical protein
MLSYKYDRSAGMEEGIDPRKLEGVGRDDSQFNLRFLDPLFSLRVPNIVE